jgi:hypothetical protein
MSASLDPAAVNAWALRSRRAQGLPDQITDPAILARVAALAFAGNDAAPGKRARRNGGKGGRRRAPAA